MSSLRLLLIHPASTRVRNLQGRPRPTDRIFQYPVLPCLYVAAAAPPYVQTRIVDEDVEAIDFEADVDLVGLSFMSAGAPRAYEVADRFRARGIPVIMGGYHPTLVPDEAARSILTEYKSLLESLARADTDIAASGEHIPQSAKSIVGADIEVVVPLEGLVDLDAERARIRKEIGKTDKEIAFVEKKLNNPKFVDKAPAEVVEKERERLKEETTRKERLNEALEALS